MSTTKTEIAWTERTWRPVLHYPGYWVNTEGQLMGPSRKLLKQMRNERGYLYIFARDETGIRHKLFAHTAVLLAFQGDRPTPLHQTRHLDGTTTNNRLANLAWGTPLENSNDKHIHGTIPCGEKAGSAKLTEADVREIRVRLGTKSLRALGAEFGVSHTAIRRAALGIKWGYLHG